MSSFFRSSCAVTVCLSFISVLQAQESPPPAETETAATTDASTDPAKKYTELRNSKNRGTQALADRYDDLTGIQEWVAASGKHTTRARYVAHDPDLKWIKLVAANGKEATVQLTQLNKASQAKVRQIDALQKKLDAILKTEDTATTTAELSRGDDVAPDAERSTRRGTPPRTGRNEGTSFRDMGRREQAPAEPGKVVLDAPGNHGGFFGFAFSPDGGTLAGGTGIVSVDTGSGMKPAGGGEVVLWNAQTGQVEKKLGAHGETVNWLKYSADGSRLASASKKNGILKVWDAQAGSNTQTFEVPGGKILAAAFSADGKTVAAIGENSRTIGERTIQVGGELVVWDVDSGAKKWSVPESGASHFDISSDGQTLATYSRKTAEGKPDKDGKATVKYVEPRIILFDLASGNEKAKIELKSSISPKLIMYLPGTDRLSILGTQAMSQLDPDTGQIQETFPWDKSRWAFSSAAISADGSKIARAWSDWVEVVDVATGTVQGLRNVKFPNTWHNVVFSSDLSRIACSQQGGAIIDISNLEPPAAAQLSEQ